MLRSSTAPHVDS